MMYQGMEVRLLDLSCLEGKPQINLPGSCDKENRPIILIVIPTEPTLSDITAPLQYLLSIFSDSTKNKGLTVLIDTRKAPWKSSKTYMKQVTEVLQPSEKNRVIVIKPDGFWDKQRMENCTSTQKDHEVIFIPRSRINKFVDQSQLPVALGGTVNYDHEKWIENRQKVEEFYKDAEVTIKELQELYRHVLRSRALRASQVEEAINISSDMSEATKMLVHNVIETGKELVQNIEYENRTRKLSIENIDKIFTPQDTLDTIEKIHRVVNDIRHQQQLIESAWSDIEKNLVDTKDLSVLKSGVVKVTNWILGPAEQLLNAHQKVGYDVASAEKLRREHEAIELECWEACGSYAELLHKINLLSKLDDENTTIQYKDLISQKEFMDFVCKSFALRLERRRNVLITSLRFFRLVSEYFDKTGEVFDSLIMGSDVNDFNGASSRLKKLQESQTYLESIEQDLRKEGEKLSDMLSMPVKDALGQELNTDYSEDIVNIRDVLDATVARKNIFSFFIPSTQQHTTEEEFQILCQNSIQNNETAIEVISERLSEITQLSEELDIALKSAQQDCIVFSTTSTSTSNIFPEINNNYILSHKKSDSMDKNPDQYQRFLKPDDQVRSDEEFLTASDTTLQHSRSSSYNTASECEQHFAPWWQYGQDDTRENIAKEKMVLAVGCPPEGELPPVSEVLKPSPEVPPGKIVREVTETTHIKVQQQHTLGVKSFVLTSETVRDKDAEASTTREETIKTSDGSSFVTGRELADIDDEELLKRMNEVGVLEQDGAWSNYSSYKSVTKQTIKNFMFS